MNSIMISFSSVDMNRKSLKSCRVIPVGLKCETQSNYNMTVFIAHLLKTFVFTSVLMSRKTSQTRLKHQAWKMYPTNYQKFKLVQKR